MSDGLPWIRTGGPPTPGYNCPDMVRFLLLVFSATAAAQTTVPADSEQALRARAQQFFQLQMEQKYRQAEALVAEDSKDEYYNNGKYSIGGAAIQKVEIGDPGSSAVVTIKAKVTFLMPGAGPLEVEKAMTSLWKIDNGVWCLYIDPAAKLRTPFGALSKAANTGSAGDRRSAMPMPFPTPDGVANLRSVTVDPVEVKLSATVRSVTITITNHLPGGVDLELKGDEPSRITWKLGKTHLDASEMTQLQVQSSGTGEGTEALHLSVSPMGTLIDIPVHIQ